MKSFYNKTTDRIFTDRCVWTNGCYDVLHIGHFRLFEQCRNIASELRCSFFIGIDSDNRVRKTKGQSRPCNTQDIRAESLLSIRGVDKVFVYDTDDELKNLIQTFRPHALVVGEEYRTKGVIGFEHAETVVYFPKIEGYSTTGLIRHEQLLNYD